jgi:hypothetical protein
LIVPAVRHLDLPGRFTAAINTPATPAIGRGLADVLTRMSEADLLIGFDQHCGS